LLSKSKSQDISEAQKELLASKGIGAKGNIELSGDVISRVINEIVNNECTPIFAGVMIASLKVLDLSKSEKYSFDDTVRKVRNKMTPSIIKLCFEEFLDCEEDLICKKLFHQKDLSQQDCEFLTKSLFDKSIDPVYIGVMLQGLRLKRETVSENCYLKSSFSKFVASVEWEGGALVQLAEPYDGFVRTPYLGLYLAILLSYKGYASVLHSQNGLGPKYGETCLSALREHTNANLDIPHALNSLNKIRFACVDSEKATPELSDLKVMRNQMIKRSYLATFDKLNNPIQAKGENIQVCGYVHTPYLNTLSEVLKKEKNELNILIKGIEGGVVLDPYKKMIVHSLRNGKLKQFELTQIELENKFNKNEACDAEKILSGQHYFSKHIAYTASVLISIIESRENCEQALLEIESLFKNGELIKHYHDCIHFIKEN
jgi:anthranilate phosphoribosyltransferase